MMSLDNKLIWCAIHLIGKICGYFVDTKFFARTTFEAWSDTIEQNFSAPTSSITLIISFFKNSPVWEFLEKFFKECIYSFPSLVIIKKIYKDWLAGEVHPSKPKILELLFILNNYN